MRARLGAGLLGAAAVALFAFGCSVPSSFTCTSQFQCGGGVCVIGGCAFGSEDCDSGLRYGEFAPTHLAGTCVPIDGVASDSGTETQGETDSNSDSDSDSNSSVGDGDGDGDTTATGDGDGDGDPTSGDGDGDGTTSGDGDGDDPTTGTTDDVTTSGDGDGDGGLPIPDTAIAHYTFDEILGATIVDATGNGYDATMDNNQPQVAGVVNQGLDFSNLDNVVVPPEVLAGEGAFTVEFYMWVSQAQGLREFPFYYGTLDGSNPSLSAYVEYSSQPTETLRFVWNTGNQQSTVGLIGTTSINEGEWHHVALSVGQSGMRLSVDHFVDDEDPFNPNPGLPGYARIQIGGVPSGFGSFIGVIDELRFSAGVLSTNEMMPLP